MQLRVDLKQVPQKTCTCICGRLLIKICGWFSQKPKLEESSAPAAKRGRRPGRRSIEPPEKKKKPEDSRTECCVCKQSGTNSNLVRYAEKFTIVTETIMDLVFPSPRSPEFGITIVSDFSRDDCNTQEKLWCIMVLVKMVKISTFLKSPQSAEELYRPFPRPEIPSSLFVCFYISLLL